MEIQDLESVHMQCLLKGKWASKFEKVNNRSSQVREMQTTFPALIAKDRKEADVWSCEVG